MTVQLTPAEEQFITMLVMAGCKGLSPSVARDYLMLMQAEIIPHLIMAGDIAWGIIAQSFADLVAERPELAVYFHAAEQAAKGLNAI
jgi:hypothetical protein